MLAERRRLHSVQTLPAASWLPSCVREYVSIVCVIVLTVYSIIDLHVNITFTTFYYTSCRFIMRMSQWTSGHIWKVNSALIWWDYWRMSSSDTQTVAVIERVSCASTVRASAYALQMASAKCSRSCPELYARIHCDLTLSLASMSHSRALATATIATNTATTAAFIVDAVFYLSHRTTALNDSSPAHHYRRDWQTTTDHPVSTLPMIILLYYLTHTF